MLVNLRNDRGIKSKELERASNGKLQSTCRWDGHLIPRGFLGKVGNMLRVALCIICQLLPPPVVSHRFPLPHPLQQSHVMVTGSPTDTLCPHREVLGQEVSFGSHVKKDVNLNLLGFVAIHAAVSYSLGQS